jgi:hypothetical protein
MLVEGSPEAGSSIDIAWNLKPCRIVTGRTETNLHTFHTNFPIPTNSQPNLSFHLFVYFVLSDALRIAA